MTDAVTYSPETIAAYGKVIEVGTEGNSDEVLVALRYLAMMVHCDIAWQRHEEAKRAR